MKSPALRRLTDIIIADVGLALFSIPMLVLFGISKYESTRAGLKTALFTQTRYGLNSKPFDLYKIRTLDGKLEPFPIAGSFRKLGLDELPQLINIHKGDMSFFGPRPLVDLHVEVPGWLKILQIRPGLVGLNTIIQKEFGINNSPDIIATVEGDYIDARNSKRGTFFQDINILWRAIKIVILARADVSNTHDKMDRPETSSGCEIKAEPFNR